MTDATQFLHSSICLNITFDHYADPELQVANGQAEKSIIVKFVNPDETKNTVSHQRKVNSYEVESTFYEKYASKLKSARVAAYHGTCKVNHQRLIVLEDLRPEFPRLKRNGDPITPLEKTHLIDWLAQFHLTYMSSRISDLSERGSYWHLETRRDELLKMREKTLKSAAEQIDRKLRELRHQTLIHGDAKLPNFCFGKDSVAAVDFQYVGPGCGLADLWYLFSDS